MYCNQDDDPSKIYPFIYIYTHKAKFITIHTANRGRSTSYDFLYTVSSSAPTCEDDKAREWKYSRAKDWRFTNDKCQGLLFLIPKPSLHTWKDIQNPITAFTVEKITKISNWNGKGGQGWWGWCRRALHYLNFFHIKIASVRQTRVSISFWSWTWSRQSCKWRYKSEI